jgi:hypothetical protein
VSTRIVPKLKDRDLVQAFLKVVEALHEKEPTLSYFDDFDQPIQPDILEKLKKLNGYEIRTACISFDNCVWKLRRLEDLKSPSVDNLIVEVQGQTLENARSYGHRPNDYAAFYKASALIAEKLSRSRLTGPDAPQGDGLQSHQVVLNELESLASKIIVDTEEHRKNLDREHIENERRRQEHFDANAAESRKNIDDERLRLDAEYTKRIASLDEREVGLNDLKKQLDDRNNTHVRREIRSSLLSLAKERLDNFTISGTTRKQHLAVNLTSVVGLLALAGASFYFGNQISIDPDTKQYPPEAIALIIKSASYAAAAIALGSWYLGWLNRWLQKIADSEFKLQQFRLDIERASWLAETVLEWKSTSQEPFPELLAARLSSGLFQSQGSDADGPRTPASHLAEALLGSASSTKLKFGENELNFDRKGIQKLEE